MSAYDFKSLKAHVGHDIECVTYGIDNVVLECVDCGEILLSFDDEEDSTVATNAEALEQTITWRPVSEHNGDDRHVLIRHHANGVIKTGYYMVWNEGGGDDEDRCWHAEDTEHRFVEWPHWAEIEKS